ncbi:hypothetical protein JCM9140_892 [Halalkalibacter wakoensis JCM 9140]|uniref:Lipoprotein n=1 Tax=Halalkalibacter wakoensis JCM 9140 TaxID=1236970 RepID=W4PYP5_9BACI|nr:hypothetical protein [Halalkalibacter wakoensis]GAE24926.1 hypothetical protein JCM9140_892 [Halalkalibacter wakoensis JCM 9140]
MKLTYLLLALLFLVGCNNEELTENPNIEGHIHGMDEREFFIMVDDLLTEEERQSFVSPKEIEAYRITFDEEVPFYDENGNEVTWQESYPSLSANVWVKGDFQSEITKLEKDDPYANLPVYKAGKVEIRSFHDITFEEVISRYTSDKEGSYCVYVFMEDDVTSKEGNVIQADIHEIANLTAHASYIKCLGFTTFSNDSAIDYQEILTINHPTEFFVFDHKGIVFQSGEINELEQYLRQFEWYKGREDKE